MSLRFILGALTGFAAGFAASRALEAHSLGVPLGVAFDGSNLLLPVNKLQFLSTNPPAPGLTLTPAQRRNATVGPDDILQPDFIQDAEYTPV